jgi:hypothetical protein
MNDWKEEQPDLATKFHNAPRKPAWSQVILGCDETR